VRTLLSLLFLGAAGRLSADELASPTLSASRMLADVKVLSSDTFEGRGPGTAGEDKTVAYLTRTFEGLGLAPGNPNGSFVQEVPMIGITAKTRAVFTVGSRTLIPAWINDYIAVSRRTSALVQVKESEMVFVGYGVIAPEYGWDDFKGTDVRGKTVIMLVNDPQVPDPRDPHRLDDSMFKGKAMTYYGRWTYKYEEASALGAAACLIVHEPILAGYPFAVLAASQGRENFDLRTPDGNANRVGVEGWLTLKAAQTLFRAAGLDFSQLKAAAVRRDFHPVPLGARASFTVVNTIRDIASHNVIAKLPGSDPSRRNEYVIYTAHWDHLGRDPRLPGDQIFHGAVDNGSGVAGLIEIARAYAILPPAERPKRSVLFLAVTGEEKGLLGSRYYVGHPLYPLARTLADLNLDMINVHGRTQDLQSIGRGASTLDDVAAAVARDQGRFIVEELHPENGMYFRSDHFEFAKGGVPSCMIRGGWHFVGEPDDYGLQLDADYTAHDYHKVTDTIKPDWTMAGGAQDAETLLQIGRRVADADRWPEWKPGNEFQARRAAMLAAEPNSKNSP
jgi:Zn-dependent M28 family amino/carboxypeptidase